MLNVKLNGFGASPEALYYIDKISEFKEKYELDDFISRVRQLSRDGDVVHYSLPGLPLCWKCTVKHLGEAVMFAREVEAYPERIVCVVGALEHAYEECPNPETAKALRLAYTRILDTGCMPDFTELLGKVAGGWRQDLQEAK